MRWMVPLSLVIILASCGYTGPLFLPKEQNRPIKAIPSGATVLDQSEPIKDQDSYALGSD